MKILLVATYDRYRELFPGFKVLRTAPKLVEIQKVSKFGFSGVFIVYEHGYLPLVMKMISLLQRRIYILIDVQTPRAVVLNGLLRSGKVEIVRFESNLKGTGPSKDTLLRLKNLVSSVKNG